MLKERQSRILLIEPPFYRLHKETCSLSNYPLALGYLSGEIQKLTRWSVAVYNADFNPDLHKVESLSISYIKAAGFHNYLNCLKDISKPIWEDVRSVIAEYAPGVIGISAKSQNFVSACRVAKIAKTIDQDTIIIMGGPHPSLAGVDVLACPDIDIAVYGEGEETVVELLNSINASGKLDMIDGIIYREDGKIIKNKPRKLIENLDSLCFPNENAPDVLRDYRKYPTTSANIFATRGCPYRCVFCGSHKIWSEKVRFRSPANIIREIKLLQERGVEVIHFEDDIFGVNKKYIHDLCCAIIADCPGLKWSCELHVKLVEDEIVSLMKKAGCYLIRLGIESGSDEILKKVKKDITIKEAVMACKAINKYKIELQTFFMFGFPWETERTLRDTLSAIKKTRSIFIYSLFTPYPGTEAFEICKANGTIGDNYDLSLYHHQSPVNYFCPNIPRDRFFKILSKIDKIEGEQWQPESKRLINRVRKAISSMKGLIWHER